jgi:hypothetical protein
MSSPDRRAAARRRAWGRGPRTLRVEPLEGRVLLAANPHIAAANLVPTAFSTPTNLAWGQNFQATGTITNEGNVAAMAPYQVDVFASPGPAITKRSVLIGTIAMPGGLAPGASSSFSQSMTLPATPLPGTSANSGNVYVDVWVDSGANPEVNPRNNRPLGLGADTSVVTITPIQSADLIGTALGVMPNSTTWGSTLNLTLQVQNNGAGDAPATRAKVVLTPSGITPGGSGDVTIGSISVPPIPAFQTANLVSQVTLPAVPPSLLAGSTSFTLTVVQDADFQTNPLVASQQAQGLGYDQAQITIAPPANPPDPNAPKPDLTASNLQVPGTAAWGQTIPVSATIQNIGLANAGPFRVWFLLTGLNGSLADALFLGQAQISSLAAGASQTLNESLQIPGALPAGMTINGNGFGRILVYVNPEHTVDESLETNNLVSSGPITLRLLGTNGNNQVPTLSTVTASTVLAADGVHLGAPTPAGTLAARRRTPVRPSHNVLKGISGNIDSFFKKLGKNFGIK